MMIFHFRVEREMHENKDEEAKRLLKMQNKRKKKYYALHPGVREVKSQLFASVLSHSDNSRRFAHPNPLLRSVLRILAKRLAEIPPFACKYKNEGE